MKKLIGSIAVCLVMAAGCKKAENVMYNDIARVQLSDTGELSATFVYDAASVVKDTIYIQVNTIGGITGYDRQVKLMQVPEYTYTYVRDPQTNQITDTVKTAVPYTAVPGIHYVDLNDPSLAPLMVVKANEVVAMVPVVLLRDTSLKTNSYRLRLQLVANEQFGLGEINARSRTVVFSDHLERFFSWRVDNGVAPAFTFFGKYSIGKHQFMINTLKVNIDEEWYQAMIANGALQQYQNALRVALAQFNNDPANIASGKAPLRETDSPTSAVVTFP